MITSKEKLSPEFYERVLKTGIVCQALVKNGFYVYANMNFYSLQLSVHVDTLGEARHVYNFLCVFRSTWKSRSISKVKYSDSKFYVIRLDF